MRPTCPPIGRLLRPGAPILALVKPQFEAGKGQVGRGGVVRDERLHRRILVELWTWVAEHGFVPRGLTASPIRGPAGNVEFLLWLENGRQVGVLDEIAPGTGPDEPSMSLDVLVEAALAEAPSV